MADQAAESPLPPFPAELVDPNKAELAYLYLVGLRLPQQVAARHWRRWCIVTGSQYDPAWGRAFKASAPLPEG
jgi:hypothetical protein